VSESYTYLIDLTEEVELSHTDDVILTCTAMRRILFTLSIPAWVLYLFAGISMGLEVATLEAAEYWVAPDGNDRNDGTSRGRAWASPSRGQPTRINQKYISGEEQLMVSSTEGFLDQGHLTIDGETRTYHRKTADRFELIEPFTKDITEYTRVFDADFLSGESFSPGDVINLAGGTYLNRPLNFCRSGLPKQSITYRSTPGERAILVSDTFNRSPIRHLGTQRTDRTHHVIIANLCVRNSADGNHGAPGIDLFGVTYVTVANCDVDISGRDINGDNNAIRLFSADHVTITGCRLRSRYANAIAAWATSDTEVSNTVMYESFHGVVVTGGRYSGHLSLRNCTLYSTNHYGGVHAESPGTISVSNSIIAQMPSLDSAALNGNGNGDYNCVWHAAVAYGKGWNASPSGAPGQHDTHTDPQFISLNPASPYFLKFSHDSPAAKAGAEGSWIGAFPPIETLPPSANTAMYDVRDFGAVGDGIHDDTNAILAAVAAAKKGGTVVIPSSSKHYLIGKTIRLNHDHVHLYGPGATLKLKAGAGRIHMIEVSGNGPAQSIVEHVNVEGLTLDGNYHQQPQQRSGGHPRCVWVANARHVVLKKLVVRDAYSGISFAPITRDCAAIDVTMTDWDHDGYGASGWGTNGGCTDIRFIRCKAVSARCVKAWEIEEGAQRVRLEDCFIEDLQGTGTGFYVRHHEYRWPLLVDDITFVRCRVRNVSGAGFLITTVPGAAIRPFIRTQNVRLIDCEADERVTIACGVEHLQINGGSFGTMALGYDAGAGKPVDRGPKWPVRSIAIDNARIKRLVINAQTGNPNGKCGDKYYPDYEPSIRLTDVQTDLPMEIFGENSNVVIER